MSISQNSNPLHGSNGLNPTPLPNLSYARQLLGDNHLNDCLHQGKGYVCRLLQGAWFLHQTEEPSNYYRAYREIIRYLQDQPEADHV